jgi:hypothetical protein
LILDLYRRPSDSQPPDFKKPQITMIIPLKPTFSLVSALSLAIAPTAFSATTFSAIVGYDPNTYWAGGVTAGIDFNDGSPTQSGFTGIAASNNTTYNVLSNGITFDIGVRNTNTGNQNRDRGAAGGDLVRDFEQWFNNLGTGVLVEATVSLSGLLPNTDYDISFFTFNIGAGQSTHTFYDGAAITDPVITTFTTGGNQLNFATWSPGVTITTNSGVSGVIDLTVQSNSGSRLTLNGIAVQVIPEPSSAALLALAGFALFRRSRR